MTLSREEIIGRIRDAGVVGAGGAGFPTYAKLAAQAETFIVNIAECEPLLRVDQQIARHFSRKIIGVLDLFHECLGIKRSFLAIKKKYADAVSSLSALIRDKKHITLFFLEDCYPAGDEQDIVYNVTGKTVPEGGIPPDVGVIVDNAGTVLHVYEAVFEKKPVTSRWVTIAGDVREPKTLNLPIGTVIREALALCGGSMSLDPVILDGGPMMGVMVPENDTVKKTTSGLLVLPREHPFIRRKKESIIESILHSRTACEQCSLCTEYCSRYILGHRDLKPHLMMRRISYLNKFDLAEYTEAYLCSGCGLCTYFACPMLLAPGDIYKFLKTALVRNGIPNPYRKKPPEAAHPVYAYRRAPIEKLKLKLGLKQYDHEAGMDFHQEEIRSIRISLKQHIGERACPVVSLLQKVSRGDLVAQSPGQALGSRLHSGISGTVREITEEHILVDQAEGR